jgi:hypothetical protein
MPKTTASATENTIIVSMRKSAWVVAGVTDSWAWYSALGTSMAAGLVIVDQKMGLDAYFHAFLTIERSFEAIIPTFQEAAINLRFGRQEVLDQPRLLLFLRPRVFPDSSQ